MLRTSLIIFLLLFYRRGGVARCADSASFLQGITLNRDGVFGAKG
ncbi:MAG TPA: hypothetical protein VFY40_00720 [Blastocatellia bacterium]|nr:hypothetical protein [Blastocatellia bacterium]